MEIIYYSSLLQETNSNICKICDDLHISPLGFKPWYGK